ncbi:MAG: response regulator [Terriglobales bacterium]
MKTILIAEDDPASRELLAEILRAAGYGVVEAGDGAKAIILLEHEPPDAAILDIQMPIQDGFAVLQYVRQHMAAPQPLVIAVSAHALLGERERALQMGFDEYLTKPVEIALLRQRLHDLLP